MRYQLNIPGFERRQPVLVTGLLGGASIEQGGKPAPSGKASGSFDLRQSNGRVVTAYLRPRLWGLDPVPVVEIDGTPYDAAAPFAWYQWLFLLVLVVPLISVGVGLPGLVFGFVGFNACVRLLRSQLSPPLRVLACLAVSAAGTAIEYGIVAAFGLPIGA